ncbi:MAG TPA: ATP-binding cassette domain-containing protein, partial [Lachnospiraceae bacterium]|nr:ATP-binding cassette domain-containing protein [Lachnospiraceae bacterium]
MEKAIHIDNLSVYYGRTAALTNICLDVYEGEFLGIMGPNGGGKSTLLKSVLGLIPITSGTIQLYNQAPGRNGTLIGYVPQFATMDKKFPISAVEVVLTGLLKHGLKPFAKFSKRDRDFAMELLDKVGIVDLANRQIAGLSGGEFQKMLIARALAVRPRLLLLDE